MSEFHREFNMDSLRKSFGIHFPSNETYYHGVEEKKGVFNIYPNADKGNNQRIPLIIFFYDLSCNDLNMTFRLQSGLYYD